VHIMPVPPFILTGRNRMGAGMVNATQAHPIFLPRASRACSTAGKPRFPLAGFSFSAMVAVKRDKWLGKSAQISLWILSLLMVILLGSLLWSFWA
jgi:hypothetical protein